MKTHFFCAAISSLIFCNYLFAQNTTTVNTDDDGPPVVYIGARYMPTFTSFNVKTLNNGYAQTSFALGYGAGAYAGVNLSNYANLQLEVIYSQLSQHYSDNSRVNNVQLNYLYVPLLLGLNTGINKAVNINISAGPQIGINMGSRITTQNSGNNTDSVNAIIAVKAADLGLAYGAGIDFTLLPPLTLELGFRAMFGFIDISDKSKSITTSQYYILDRSFVKTYAAYAGLRLSF